MSVHPSTTWNLPRLMNALEAKYHEQGLTPYWAHERESIKARLSGLRNKIGGRYVEPEVRGIGGSGVVLRLTDDELAGRGVALKFPRPVAGQQDLLAVLLNKEIHHLVGLRHASIVRIHASGTAFAGDTKFAAFPYYIMDFIDGPASSKYFATTNVSEGTFVGMLDQVVDALTYLHSRDTVHLDVKPDNILIGDDGIPVIADLGTAKRLSDETDDTIVACTRKYADPELLKLLDKDPSDPNRSKGDVPHKTVSLQWDLVPLGKTLLHWLGYDNDGGQLQRRVELRPYARKYLLLMACRMLHGHVEPWAESRTGLGRHTLKELAYSSMSEILTDVRKLSGRFSIVEAVPELNAYSSDTLQIAADSATTYSKRLKQLIGHSAVRRLASISQLGAVNQVYPTAIHSRYEHSVGTYHNACKFVLSLYHDPLSPLFCQIVRPSDITTVLVASLLHDIGQYPLAHDLEEIDPKMFDHKRLGEQMLLEGAKQTHKDSLGAILASWQTSAERVVDVLRAKADDEACSTRDRLLHSIIDGPIDADKMDYLKRDSDRLRLPYGAAVDRDRLFRSLTVILPDKAAGSVVCVGVHEKAKVPAEFMAMARYALFSQAYWQHTVRAIKAMLARAVQRLLVGTRDRGQRAWRTGFERFVLSLPDSLYRQHTDRIQGGLFEPAADDILGAKGAPRSGVGVDLSATQTTLAPTDAAVLVYLRDLLIRDSMEEAELVDDLLSRTFYKRLLVFSSERSTKEWRFFIDSWEPLSSSSRLKAYQLLEAEVARRVQATVDGGEHTASLSPTLATRLAERVAAKKPLLLIDVPGSRPGSETPLQYVLEAQRRALRKDERAIGDVQESESWKQFGTHLRDRVAKARIFCHPDFVDCVEAVVDRSKFMDILTPILREV